MNLPNKRYFYVFQQNHFSPDLNSKVEIPDHIPDEQIKRYMHIVKYKLKHESKK